MARFPKQKIDEQYRKLPEELKDAIFSSSVAEKVIDIGRRFTLSIEETGILGEETGYIMLGLVRPEDFQNSLKDRLDLDEEDAEKLAHTVNSEIFFPIRELFRKAHRTEITESLPKAEVKTKPTPPEKTVLVENVPPATKEKEVREALIDVRPVPEEKISSYPPPATLVPAKISTPASPPAAPPQTQEKVEPKPTIDLREPGKVIPRIPRNVILAPAQATPKPPLPSPLKPTELITQEPATLEANPKPAPISTPIPTKVDPYRENTE